MCKEFGLKSVMMSMGTALQDVTCQQYRRYLSTCRKGQSSSLTWVVIKSICFGLETILGSFLLMVP